MCKECLRDVERKDSTNDFGPAHGKKGHKSSTVY